MPAMDLLGHSNCVGHLPCLSEKWSYNPSRCGACISFYNSKFVGASSLVELEEPRKELERFINKIKRVAKKENKTLSLHQLALSIRRKSTSIEYFQSLSLLELDYDRTQTEEFSSSSASVASTSGLSKQTDRSRKTERSSKSKSNKSDRSRSSHRTKSSSSGASSRSKNTTSEQLALVLSQVSQILVNQTGLKAGQESLKNRVGCLEKAQDQSRSESHPPVPLEPNVIVEPLGSPSSFPSPIPVTVYPALTSPVASPVSTSVVFSSAGHATSLPPVFSVPSAPVMAVPSSSALGLVSSPLGIVPVSSSPAQFLGFSPLPSVSSLPPPVCPSPGPRLPNPSSQFQAPVSVSEGSFPFSSGRDSAVVSGSGLPSGSGSGFFLVPGKGGFHLSRVGEGGVGLGVEASKPSVPPSQPSVVESGFVSGGGGSGGAVPAHSVVSVQEKLVLASSDPQAGLSLPRSMEVVMSMGVPISVRFPDFGVEESVSVSSGSKVVVEASKPSVEVAGTAAAVRDVPASGKGEGLVSEGPGVCNVVSKSSAKRGFSVLREGGVGGGEGGELGDEGVDEYDEVVDLEGFEASWSQWRVLEEPYSILRDGPEPVSVYNRVSQALFPWSRVETKKEEGVQMFRIRSEPSKCVMFPRSALSDRRKLMSFCAQFPQFTDELSEPFVKLWPKSFCTLSQFNDKELQILRYPLDHEDMVKVFRQFSTGSSVISPRLRPSVVTFLRYHSELVGCLPTLKFSSDAVASLFGLQAGQLVSLNPALLSEEHTARMHMLAMTVIFTAVQVYCSLAKNSVAPSALEAAGFSLFSGIAPFVTFAWIQAYHRFCKARVSLRKSVFREPIHSLATQVISEDPFSRDLFSDSAIRDAAKEFYKENLVWGALLKLSPKGMKSVGRARRPVYRPYQPYRRQVPQFQQQQQYRGAYSGRRRGNAGGQQGGRSRQPFSRRGGHRRGRNL